MGIDFDFNFDEVRRDANNWARDAIEQEHARTLARRARELGLSSTGSLELGLNQDAPIGGPEVNPARIRKLADELLASGADLGED